MEMNEDYDDDAITDVGLAARQGNAVLLKELLLQGHPTNGHDNRGWHPLHEAAAGGHVECVRWLLIADAEVDAMNHDGATALYLACEPGECQTEVVKLLLLAGADPDMKCNNDPHFPLANAVGNNLYDIVKLLLDAGANPNSEDVDDGTPFMIAANNCYLKIARLLVERGAKVDFENDNDQTALHFLLLPPSGSIEDSTYISFIDLMVNGGLDINAQMSDNNTPLTLAIEGKKVGAILRLLELGADPNIQKEFGGMALHEAIKFFPDYSMEQHDGSNSKGVTTDHILRRLLDLTLRELVIPEKLPKLEFSIFHVAIRCDKFNTLKLMVNDGLPPDVFLGEMVSVIRLKCLLSKVLIDIELGLEVNTPLGLLLLSKPLNKKHVELAKFMIDKGSNVNVVVPRCLPPLVAAVKHQEALYSPGCPGLDILEHLLNNGVDVLHKIRATDILPAALHISSLFNVQAFFVLLVRCVPVHEIYTPWKLASLSQLYAKYYKVYPLWPWRVISWLNVVNAFVPQLPLDTRYMFDIQRMVEDDNLSRAWDNLDAQIGSPKKLEQLCILTVRRVVGECRGWNRLTTFLRKLTLMNEPLLDLIMDLLTFKQMESSCLSKWPPHEVLSRYILSAANRDDEDDDYDEDNDDDYDEDNDDDYDEDNDDDYDEDNDDDYDEDNDDDYDEDNDDYE